MHLSLASARHANATAGLPRPAHRRGEPVHRAARNNSSITRITGMELVSDVYTIPQEHLDFCETIGQIARERDRTARS